MSAETRAESQFAASVLTSRELNPLIDGCISLLAVLSPNLVAVSTCGHLIHIFRGGERLCTWRLPSCAVLLQWAGGPCSADYMHFAIAVTADGHGWRLGVDDASTVRSGPKRARASSTPDADEATRWSAPLSAGDQQRLQLPPLHDFASVVGTDARGILLRSAHLPRRLLPTTAESGGRAWDDAPSHHAAQGSACIMCVRNAAGNAARPAAGSASDADAVPLAAPLFEALVGGTAAWMLHVDDACALYATALQDDPARAPGGAAGRSVRLMQLGQPAVQLLASRPAASSSSGASPSGEARDCLVVLLGAQLLVLSSDGAGGLRRQLWQLPSYTHAACWLASRDLLLLGAEEAYVVEVPAASDVSPLAEAAARARGAPRWVGGAAGRLSAVGDVPVLPARPVALSGTFVAAAQVCSGLHVLREGFGQWEVVLLSAEGVLSHLRLTTAAPDRARAAHAPGASPARVDVAGAFCAPFIEQSLRRQLRLIGSSGAELRRLESESKLREVAVRAAGNALSAVSALHSDVSVSADMRPVVALRNDGQAPLGPGWSITAVLVEQDVLPAAGSAGFHAAICSRPVGGLPAGVTWRVALPLTLRETSRPAMLLLLACFSAECPSPLYSPRAGTPRHPHASVALWIGRHPLSVLQLLRPPRVFPPVLSSGSLAVERQIRAMLSHPDAAAPSTAAAGSGLPSEAHFKLRLRAPRASLPSLLEGLFRGSALAGTEALGRAACGSHALLSAELPSGVDVTVRMATEASLSAGLGEERALLVVQCASAESLWALRGALLQQLLCARARGFEAELAARLNTGAAAPGGKDDTQVLEVRRHSGRWSTVEGAPPREQRG